MACLSRAAQKSTDPFIGSSYWLRSKVTNLFKRHQKRWPISPEFCDMSLNGSNMQGSIFQHSNVDIGVYGCHCSSSEREVRDDISQPCAELDGGKVTATAEDSNNQEPSVPTTSINFSRPLVGPSRYSIDREVAERSRDGELEQLIDSFPLPSRRCPGDGSKTPENAKDECPGEDVALQINDHFQVVASVKDKPFTQNNEGITRIEAQRPTSKTENHFNGSKPIPKRTESYKFKRYTPYPCPRTIRLAKGSLEGLIRYRRLEKGELTPLPEIKRLSGLMGSFKRFGLVDAPSLAKTADIVANCNPAWPNGTSKQSADHRSNGSTICSKLFRISGDRASIDLEGDRLTSSRGVSHLDPLRSNPVSKLELSYARHLSSSRRVPPLPPFRLHHMSITSLQSGLMSKGKEDSIHPTCPPQPSRRADIPVELSAEGSSVRHSDRPECLYPLRPPRPKPPTEMGVPKSSPAAYITTDLQSLTTEDTLFLHSPNLRGEGCRYLPFRKGPEDSPRASYTAS